MMYIKNQDLENPEDRGCVVIPPSDPVHKLLASYSSVNTTKDAKKPAAAAAAQVDTAKDIGGYTEDGPAEDYGSDGDDDVPAALPAMSGYSSLFPGLPGSSSASSSEIKMKVHSGGLRSLDDFPALSATGTAQVPAQTAAVAGGSAVGGWGVDKGAVWKPVSLSTARAAAAATTGAAGSQKVGGRGSSVMEAEFPTLSASNIQGNQPNKGKGPQVVYSELPTELLMRKEDVYKAILKKASPYFGVISHNGEHDNVCVHCLTILCTDSCVDCYVRHSVGAQRAGAEGEGSGGDAHGQQGTLLYDILDMMRISTVLDWG